MRVKVISDFRESLFAVISGDGVRDFCRVDLIMSARCCCCLTVSGTHSSPPELTGIASSYKTRLVLSVLYRCITVVSTPALNL